jgi:hypothetical protein
MPKTNTNTTEQATGLKVGAWVDVPKQNIYGGRIQKIAGRIAYLAVYHSYEGEIVRHVLVDDLEQTGGKGGND